MAELILPLAMALQYRYADTGVNAELTGAGCSLIFIAFSAHCRDFPDIVGSRMDFDACGFSISGDHARQESARIAFPTMSDIVRGFSTLANIAVSRT